jgi:hypothetical protein
MPNVTLATRLKWSVHNNAVWCDTVCRAHDIPGEFQSHLWLNRYSVPPYYPNAVTLSGKSGIAEQMIAIQDLLSDRASKAVSVKDSFNTLDLAPLGFHCLFEAMWLWRAPLLSTPPAVMEDIRWDIVKGSQELAQWELAWAGVPTNDQSTSTVRIFLPSMLANPDIVFVAAYRDQQIVGGAIGTRTGNVVGLSNQFAPSSDAARYWLGCMALITAAYPDHAIVGYEHGAELALARTLGFDELGPLRVWVRAGASM